MITIEVLDPVSSKITPKPFIKKILPCISYEKEYWIKLKDGKKRKKKYQASPLDKRSGLIPSGLVPRIRNFCRMNGHSSEIINSEYLRHDEDPITPKLKGITFRKDQQKALDAIFKHQRGVIVAPPGSGKTLVIMGLVSAYPESKALMLCHNLSIVEQTRKRMAARNFPGLVMAGGDAGKWRGRGGKIVVSTIQSFADLDPELYMTYFDIVMIDEVHWFSKRYEKLMKLILAPIRIGFTATMPEEPERRLSIEGYTGRIISKLSVKRAAELKILAEPKIKLIPVPTSKGITPYTAYPEVYEIHITYNSVRNGLIASEVKKNLNNNITTLIMVTQIQHGKEIQETAYNQEGINIPFIQGSTKSNIREKVKEALESKKFKVVITTTIFREGINIRSLGCIIMAFGGKSPIATVQALGRSLRRTSEKDEALIIDFLDPVRYLSIHTIERLGIYLKNGWSIISE